MPRRLLICLFLAAALLSCSKKKTDAQRAIEERRAIRARAESASLQVLAYRWTKTAVRSQAAGDAIPSIARVNAALAQTAALPEKVETAEDAARVAASFVALGQALHAARGDLERHDEDDFPLLWTALARQPPALPWYDAPAEHLLLAVAVQVADERFDATDLVLYELSRAEPGAGWPAGLRLAANGARGVVFCRAGFHYAAEEELNGYLQAADALAASLDSLDEGQRAALALELHDSARLGPAQTVAALQAGGHLARGWNRMGLDRNEQATEDFEEALEALARAGVENEVTDWATVIVALQRGQLERAGTSLDRLAKSPHLDAQARAKLARAAAELREKGDAKGLLASLTKAQGAWLVAGALVSRLGGLEPVLAALAGEEQGRRLAQRLRWLERVRRGLAEHASLDGARREAGQLAGEGKRAATAGWTRLEGRLAVGLAEQKPDAGAVVEAAAE